MNDNGTNQNSHDGGSNQNLNGGDGDGDGDGTPTDSAGKQAFPIEDVATYWIPNWETYRADKTTKIEDVGIPPMASYAIAPEESYSGEEDFVLKEAIELLTE